MIHVGIICKEPRFGISTEKGTEGQTLILCMNKITFSVFSFKLCDVFCLRLQYH